MISPTVIHVHTQHLYIVCPLYKANPLYIASNFNTLHSDTGEAVSFFTITSKTTRINYIFSIHHNSHWYYTFGMYIKMLCWIVQHHKKNLQGFFGIISDLDGPDRGNFWQGKKKKKYIVMYRDCCWEKNLIFCFFCFFSKLYTMKQWFVSLLVVCYMIL